MEKRILRKIENLRRELNKYGSTHNLVDKEVVELSQRLDKLLNQYYRINSYEQLKFW